MISFLQGNIRTFLSDPHRVILVSGGVGYEVLLPEFIYHAVLAADIGEGDDAEFEIFYSVSERQPRPTLVGFHTYEQKAFFEQLITVKDIGPVKAVKALNLTPAEIVSAIEAEDTDTLRQMNGIGERAAQSIIATLKGKLLTSDFAPAATQTGTGTGTGAPSTPETSVQSEAAAALVSLKYRPREARLLVQQVLELRPDLADDLQSILREVFKMQAQSR